MTETQELDYWGSNGPPYRAADRERYESRTREFHARAAGILEQLTGEWTIRSVNAWQTHVGAVRTDGLRITMSGDADNRIGVSAWTPHHTDGRSFMLPDHAPARKDITATLTKTDEQIARDMERRFLPRAEARHALALVLIGEQEEREAALLERKRRIHAAIGDPPTTLLRERTYFGDHAGIRASVKESSIRISVEVRHTDDAERVIRTLRTLELTE